MLNQAEERLQKALARAGIASRRACEELIAAGRVKVNGKTVTQLGTKIDPARDKITVDDAPVPVRHNIAPQKIYMALNKPTGYISTVTDPQGRPTVLDLIAGVEGKRLYPVGRLDADSEGLLLLTNDGAFANALTHPRYGVEKEYIALLDGIIAIHDIESLRLGVTIRVEDPQTGERVAYLARAVKVDLVRHEGSNSLVRFILKEGKKRQIRLMAEAVEHPVIELKRVRFGPLKLADLPSGQHRMLSKAEVNSLVESAKQRPVIVPATAGKPAPNSAKPRLTSSPSQKSPAAPRSRSGPSAFGKPRTSDRPERPARPAKPSRSRKDLPQK